MNKHPLITRTLNQFETDLGCDAFVIADHWEGDLRASAVAKPEDNSQLAYFCLSIGNEFLFDYELETAPADPNDMYDVLSQGAGITYGELLEIVRVHLGVRPPYTSGIG